MKISDAARYLHQSEKTVRRWIQQKKLPARLVKGRYEIDNNALAALVGDTPAPLDTRDMLEALQRDIWEVGAHLGRLEASINELKTQLATLATTPQPRVLRPAPPEYTTRDETLEQVPTDLQAGTMHLADLASKLGINRRTLLDNARKHEHDELPHFAIPIPGRPGKFNRYFTPEQQEQVARWFHL